MRREDILNRKEDILKWIDEHQSKAFMCRQLSCKPETLNSYLKKMGIEYAGNKGLKGIKTDTKYKTAEEYIKGNSVSSHKLKIKLIRDGVKKDKCEICGVSMWLGKKLPLELHHKNGNHFDNNFDNLQILCPNCHAMQNNNSGKAVKIKANIRKLEEEKIPCPKCGKPMAKNSKQCLACAHKEQYVCEHPSREELKEMIRTIPFTQIAKKYGVSDKAIAKWCIGYNLPSKKKDIKAISDEDWLNI